MPRRDTPPSFHGLVPLDDAWDLVIKVKYGATLKRFNACVNGSHFDHNLAAVRSKIANAFKFSPNDELILTYTDEDGDVVLLDDDDDLCDAAVSQKLNPLRIDVQLKSSSAGAPQTKQQFSNSRSPMSTALEDQLAQVKSAIDEALKFLPEQVPVVLAKLSHELRSKAASSAPSLAELLDRIAKLMTPKSGTQPSSGPADSSSGSSSGEPQTLRNFKINHESELAAVSSLQSSDTQNPKSSKGLGLKSVLVEETKAQVEEAPGYTSVQDPSVSASSGGKLFVRKKRTDAQSKGKSHAQSRGKSVMSSSVPPVAPVATIAHGVPALDSATGYELNGYMPFGSNGKINGDLHSIFPPSRGPPYCLVPTLGSSGKINDDLHSIFPPPRGPLYCPIPTLGSNGKINCGLQTAFPPPPAYNYNPFKFSMPSSVSPYGPYQEGGYSFGGSYGDPSNKYCTPQHPRHRWIQCDGCGVTPIVGPRYKSNVKDDYDLCSACFSHMGNEAKYTRIDKPTLVSERLRDIDKNRRLELDCRFIKDITVPDGTIMAPSTPFTKIWRMRYSGSTMWPFGTHLTWVGGDEFARQSSVKLAIPTNHISVNGFPVDEEIDVCVDFVAPAKPGRYISYWRLASPDLQEFGQRVWVLIQVEQPVQTSGNKQTAAINLNMPAEGNTTTWKPFIDMNVEPTDFVYEHPAGVTNLNELELFHRETNKLLKKFEAIKPKGSEAVVSAVPSAPTAVEPVQVAITDSRNSSTGAVAMPAGVPAPEAVPLPKPVSMPASTLVSAPVPAPAPVSVQVPAAPLPHEIVNHMEEKLLWELKEMGFKQVDLNKEILRQNEYDLLKSVDDLCGFHEWDPLLEELNELGFDGTEEVKQALTKDDGGSIIKRVAMNLLSREKDQ